MKTNKIIQGNAIEELKKLPDNSVDMCLTSPPYFGLRNYNLPPTIFGGDKKCNHNLSCKVKGI